MIFVVDLHAFAASFAFEWSGFAMSASSPFSLLLLLSVFPPVSCGCCCFVNLASTYLRGFDFASGYSRFRLSFFVAFTLFCPHFFHVLIICLSCFDLFSMHVSTYLPSDSLHCWQKGDILGDELLFSNLFFV
jgi:hypothetical protein